VCESEGRRGDRYLSHICAYLPNLRQELYASHPLIETQSRLARKVVHVRYQALHDVFQAWVGALRVYAVYVLSDVVDCEVFERGNRGSVRLGRGCHRVGVSNV
jgi:hypothetical protein